MPQADFKIMTCVKEAADRFSKLGATVEEVSVPMHSDGEVLAAIFPFVRSVILLPARCFENHEFCSIVFTRRNSNMRCNLPGGWL